MTRQLSLGCSFPHSLTISAMLALGCAAFAQDTVTNNTSGNSGFLTGLRGFEHFH